MQNEDLAREYRAKKNEELIRLAKKLDRLSPEASAVVMSEMTNRGLQMPGSDGSSTFAYQGSFAGGPLVVAGTDPNGRPSVRVVAARPPWMPKTAGRIAFWLGPMTGAMIVADSLRRMGHKERAKKVMLLASMAAVIEAVVIFFVSEGVARLVGFAGEIGFLLFFPPFMEKEFEEWRGANPGLAPADGWKAMKWFVPGVIMLVGIFIATFVILKLVLPQRS
jgi:hypothetical protein